MPDPFLKLLQTRSAKKTSLFTSTEPDLKGGHSQRAHSKFSASGAERWMACPGSVGLSEGLPDKTSVYAEEGTHAHEVLEAFMKITLSGNDGATVEEHWDIIRRAPKPMVRHGEEAARFIFGVADKHPGAEVISEKRVYLSFIHPEMFGTFDGAVIDHFGTLHVFDYKYGAGVSVSVRENLQMIFYAMGLAALHYWNFSRVRLWIIQPRIPGYDGPVFWDLSINELFSYVDVFRAGVKRVESVSGNKNDFSEGPHCHWCRAKSVCPLKVEGKLDKARSTFGFLPPPR